MFITSPWKRSRKSLRHSDTSKVVLLCHNDIGSDADSSQGLNLPTAAVTKSAFPLPNLKTQLANLCSELFEGKGFFILRGFDPRPFSVEENTIISLGVSSHIREHRAAQNVSGEMISTEVASSLYSESLTFLGHIIDATWTGVPRKDRPSGYGSQAQVACPRFTTIPTRRC